MLNWIQKSSGYSHIEGNTQVIVHDNGTCPWPNTPVRWWYNINGYIGHEETEAAAKGVVERMWRPELEKVTGVERVDQALPGVFRRAG